MAESTTETSVLRAEGGLLYCPSYRQRYSTADFASPSYPAVHMPDEHVHPITRRPVSTPERT